MCNAIVDPSCVVTGLVDSGFAGIAQSAGEAAGNMLVEALTWWVGTPSVDPNSDTIRALQASTMPVVVLILTASVLAQALRMVVSRKKDPAINVALGLLRYAVVTAVGLVLLGLALKAGDDLSTALVGQAMADFTARFKGLLTAQVMTNSFTLLVVSLLFFLIALVQWVLGFIRQAGVLVLAVMLPLAAAGSINDSTKGWLNKLIPWLIALVCYKPMAAMIYKIGFTMLGTGQDVSTVMTGLMVLVLAVIALPAMLRFFSWAHVSASGGGAGGVLAAGAVGAVGMAQLSGRGGAVGAAAQMERSGPQPSGAASGAASGAGGGTGGGTGGGGSGGGASAAGGESATASDATAGGTAGGATGSAAGGAAAGAAAGPAGAAAGAAVQVAKGAYQAGQAAAQQITDDGPSGGQR